MRVPGLFEKDNGFRVSHPSEGRTGLRRLRQGQIPLRMPGRMYLHFVRRKLNSPGGRGLLDLSKRYRSTSLVVFCTVCPSLTAS